MTNYVHVIERDGFTVVPNILDFGLISLLIEHLTQVPIDHAVSRRSGGAYGIRNLLNLVPLTRDIANSQALRLLVEPILGRKAQVVRGIFFDKTVEANWKVAWHQDLTIAVRERIDVEDYGPWSVKAGIVHVQPPVAILENMLTIRVHLDDTDELNGALRVIPGSHKAGRLLAEEIRDWKEKRNSVTCRLERGGAMIMRPLLLHSSSAAIDPGHRRVLHLEYCSAKLPDVLKWHEA
ncbi:MAG: phytanoyl-CoA dioxygenase family protein [Trichocoleus desertorum ATA4-8-CV12]|jgi:ectoine hydroxylase-related dioxygenase (phytanoyl-CoA dioxygenase family)|nr:phytanoyl-CoA dioxygenase family protein [Trichocoleus desertorum ATA4-8-CV12]